MTPLILLYMSKTPEQAMADLAAGAGEEGRGEASLLTGARSIWIGVIFITV